MRIRTTLLTGALLLASTFAMAQQAQHAPQAKPQAGQTTDIVATPPEGSVDFGFRAGSFDGDQARFARYTDYRDKQGALNFGWRKEAANWFFTAGANNIGYNDQAFNAAFAARHVKGFFEYNQTPLFYGNGDFTKTPYTTIISGNTATMQLNAATRQAIQNGTVITLDKNGFPSAATQAASAIGVVVSAAQIANGTLYRSLVQGADVRSRRDEAKFGVTYEATKSLDFNLSLNSYKRNGTQPWGASFAFNDAVELPLPIDNRTTDLKAEAEWANGKGMFRVGYDGSYFSNNITTLVMDNPVRATDSWAGSSYSNALLGGAARGRMSLAPNNHANTVSAAGLYKLPGRSSFNASLAVSSLQQDDDLLPFTINSVMQPGAVLTLDAAGTKWTAVSPERPTAKADVRLTVGTFNFTTRPTKVFGFTAKYRYSDWDNKTPIFHNQFNVRFDGAPENVPASASEPANIKRQTFDADASFTPMPFAAFRVGYGRDASDRTYRLFEKTTENTFRVSFDTIGNQFVTVRAKYENSKRTGNGLDEEYFPETGQQPNMRQFDVANRNRNRATLIFDLSPASFIGVSLSVFRGKDDYPDQSFGLMNNNNTGVNFGLDLMPNDKVTVGFTYGHESYDALQQSRTANPAPDASWTNVNRNWNLNTNEKDKSYGVHLDLVKALPKTEIRFGYDFSDSNNAFTYGGPRIADLISGVASTPGDSAPCGANPVPCFIPLPNATTKLQAGWFDVRYFFSPKIGIGANFLHQKYDVTDFSTPGFKSNNYDPIGGLILGYGFRPYNANVGGVRVIYLF